jgi:hypothetical protein
MKRVFWRVLLLPAMIVLLQASSCNDTENPLAEGEEFLAAVNLSDISPFDPAQGCIHLFAPGETFPCCQVCNSAISVASRNVPGGMNVKRGSSYVFRAGRNGVILDEQSCRVSTGSGTSLGVSWTGAGLDCGLGFD